MSAPRPPFLSVDGVAKRMGVHPNTVYRLIRAKELRAYKFGRSLRISQDDYAAYVRSAEVGE